MITYKACVAQLYRIPQFGKKSQLSNLKELLDLMGNPEKRLKFIHIAGTNGKGSVSKMLSSIYRESGFKVGLFTSPHLIRVNERIQVNDQPINDDNLIEAYTFVIELIKQQKGSHHPTFFEVMMLMAFYHFEKWAVDLVVLETGIGGALDCTNVIENPLACVITQIDYDHLELLGDSLEAIAKQKAGIIKKGSKVVYLAQEDCVNQIIEQAALEVGCIAEKIGKESYEITRKTHKGIDFSYKYKYYDYMGFHLNTIPLYQVTNASLVIAVVLKLCGQFPVKEIHIRNGFEAFYWPGRMEYIDGIILDGAHNLGGIKMFMAELEWLFPESKFNIIFAVKKTKDYIGMLNSIVKLKGINQLVLVSMDDSAITSNEKIEQLIKEKDYIRVGSTADEEFLSLKAESSDAILCCVGSLYLVGKIKQIMGGLEDD